MRLLTKELAIKLLDWYRESLEMMEKEGDIGKIRKIANRRFILTGACNLCKELFGQNIYGCDLIGKYAYGGYLSECIIACTETAQALQSIRTRISILETIIANEFND
jgi:hypothetical protein